MSPSTHNPEVVAAPELEAALRAFADVGANLVESYQALERRAARVEAELAVKVDELDRLSRSLEAILQALPSGVLVRDQSGSIVRTNRAASAILGLEERELVGSPTCALLQAIEHGGEAREVECGDGERRVIASKRSPIVDGDPSRGAVEILDDRTEFAALSSRLHAQEKLAALGNVASGIAHELRNPMNAIQGYAALLEQRLPLESRERMLAANVVEGVRRADRVLSSMLTLARSDAAERMTIDVRELVSDAISEARAGLEDASKWSVTSSIEPATFATFAGDFIKLRQALRNLIANGIQAQPTGGSVHVGVRANESEVVFAVGDAGPGIARELRARVLEPFFTTRAEGTGFGLALVNTIARLHGGRVEVSSDPAPLGGAEIRIHVPNVSEN